jgi:hypothetical protein
MERKKEPKKETKKKVKEMCPLDFDGHKRCAR